MREQGALEVANEKLEKLTITDELTGLYNRRYFNQIARKGAIAGQARKEALCVLHNGS